jgi:[glutamine synthetase] adenylyltransferase / [glutamine synthetase]-adenylyl-L-tyrosine phosphorylase
VTETAQPGALGRGLRIEFVDPVSAVLNLARVHEKIGGAPYESFLHVLADSPDPDSVVALMGRLLEESTGAAATIVAGNPVLLHHASLIFGHSKWLGEALIQNADLLKRLGRRQNLDRCLSTEEFRDEFARFQGRSQEPEPSVSLARFRKREYVRILLRDVSGVAGLAEVTQEISALSDALLQEAVDVVTAGLKRRHGTPLLVDERGRQRECRFAVLPLGKLGGNELNYSSDVDLMFLFDGGKEPPTAPISNREYFVQLAQQTTELLSRRTAEGQVFRIDLRLRPQGHEGELAVALPQAVRYYSEVAQDWELQAMIKARHSAGDPTLTKEFITAVAPFVYHPDVNFAAVKTALQSRERIDKSSRTALSRAAVGRTIDVKLDQGGIRDIEFLVQCLQRVYGGEERWLRSRGTLFALQKLHDKGHITGRDYHNLTKAYEFLRNLEHHLQLRHGQQLHQLPANAAELTVLAKCLHGDKTATGAAESFVDQVRSRMAAVAEVYRRIVFQEQSTELADLGSNPRHGFDVWDMSDNSDTKITQRLAIEAPQLLQRVARGDLSQHARRNLSRFLGSAATSSERYEAVLRSPQFIERALEVFDCSEYLTDVLVRHPGDIDLLQANAAVESNSVTAECDKSMVDRERAQSVLRQQFRRELFQASADDLCARRDIWELLAEYSEAADQALQNSLGIAGFPAGFAVMALGRLGSREFDVLSDGDVLFIADESADHEECRCAAERVMALLMAYTRDGTAFPIDTRLRPQGTQGELVTTCGRLVRYFSGEARAWEAISYLRLRCVAGSQEVGAQVVQVVCEGISEIAKRTSFASDLAEMRRRLEEADQNPNFKSGAGGSYDIDFLTGRLQAEHSVWSAGNLAARIAVLQQRGLISAEDATELTENAGFLRSLEHCVRLVTGRAGKWLPAGDHAQSCVAKLMGAVTGNLSAPALAEKLAEILSRTREIYLKFPF